MNAPGWIITIIISLITCVVLELNKNTLAGWLLFAAALAAMAVAGRRYMISWSPWKKGLGIAAFPAVCVCIVLVTWPPVR